MTKILSPIAGSVYDNTYRESLIPLSVCKNQENKENFSSKILSCF